MSELTIIRASWRDVMVRADGRTVAGIAVPFESDPNKGSPIIDGEGRYTERFQRGAFAQTLKRRAGTIKLIRDHNRGHLPLGRVQIAEEQDGGLYVEARVSEGSDDADYVLSLVRDGALDGFSIGGIKVMSKWDDIGNVAGARPTPVEGGRVVRTEVRLDEISLTAWPAHDSARVLAVRNQFDPSAAPSGEAGVEVVTTNIEAATGPSGWTTAQRMTMRRLDKYDLMRGHQ